MFKSIPASNIAAVYPAVLSAGGNPLGLNTNLVSSDALYPSYEYFSADSVGESLGYDSKEYDFAKVYFGGYDGASTRPNSLFITLYNPVAASAKLISGSVKSMSLDTLKASSGEITIVVNGTSVTKTVDLSAATSFSNAAEIIETALNPTTPADKVVTVTYRGEMNVFVIKTVTVGESATISFATGDFADDIKLSQAQGAVQVNGSDIDTAKTLFQRMTSYTSNFATVTYTDSNFSDEFKKDFAKELASTSGRYWFVTYDLDPSSTIANNPSSFGAWLKDSQVSGVTPIYGEMKHAALACGYAASVNYEDLNGRTTLAYRSQDGVEATVTDEQTAMALESNGYSYYGAWATANDRFVMFGNGSVSGDFAWVDNYLFQVFLNSQFQLAMVNMLRNANIPYNRDGIEIVRANLQDPIEQGVNFGGIRAGVELTNSQKNEINREVGFDASNQIFTRGWALSITLPSAQTRASRGSFLIKFFYTDGSSLQRIEMTSTNVQ